LSLNKVFDQYLRTTQIPVLEYKLEGPRVSYRWTNVVRGFAMPVRVTTSPGTLTWIRPTESWKSTATRVARPEDFRVDDNFYIVARDLLKPAADSTSARKAQ
jgi:hypothetical protein